MTVVDILPSKARVSGLEGGTVLGERALAAWALRGLTLPEFDELDPDVQDWAIATYRIKRKLEAAESAAAHAAVK